MTDLLFTIISLGATIMIIRKNSYGWLLYNVGNIFGIYSFYAKGLYYSVGLFAVYSIMNFYAYIKWRES